MKIALLRLLLPVFVLCTSLCYGQGPDEGAAKEHFKNYNFFAAIPAYQSCLRYEPTNDKWLHRLGLCHLNLNIDKTQAIRPLEKCVKQAKHDPEARYDLGRAYSYANRFDEAIEAFTTYKQEAGDKPDAVAKADKAIASCTMAREMMKVPIDVYFEPVGGGVNTEFADYYPFVSKDGSILFFTSRREENKGSQKEFDGYYSSDVWYVESKEEGWSAPINLGAVNTRYDEQVVGMNHDGSEVFVYLDQLTRDGHVFGDIYSVKKKGTKYGRKIKLNENVNSKKLESSACMSADGRTLFFASDRPGGQGGLDIYMAKQLPNGEWALPFNLGPDINTPGDEDFPTLSADGRTLYFCSDGLPGMGGFDLFKVDWEPEEGTFYKPANLGFPLNNPLDNRTISFTADSTTAYISTTMKGGAGDLDIWKVTFNEVDATPAVFVFSLLTGDSINPIAKDAYVVVLDDYGDEVGNYTANRHTGNVVMALRPGFYSVEIEVDGFDLKVVDLNVTDFHVRMGEIKKTVSLSP